MNRSYLRPRFAPAATALLLLAVYVAKVHGATASLLYVSTSSDRHIYTFSPTATQSTYANFQNLAYNVNGMALDAHGDLFVAFASFNFGNSYVEEITPAGVHSTFATGLNSPTSLAFDASGNLFVGDYTLGASGTIYKFTPSGVRSTFSNGLVSPYNDPASLAFDASGNLFVAARNRNGVLNAGRIVEFTPTGAQSTFAGNFGSNGPAGLAFDKNGNLYTTNEFSSIYKFTPGGVSSGFGAVSFPTGALAFDSNGNLFVGSNVSGGTGSIYEFTPNDVESTFVNSMAGPAYFAFGAVVPEPPTFILIAVAIALIAVWQRFTCGRAFKQAL